MIKLDLPPKPAKLTDKLIARLTAKYKNDLEKKPVWNTVWLKKAIWEMSFGKCCYTEIHLGQESKYMEVEHFYPKSLYPNKVMEWGNLLPSCKKCNVYKNNHDTGTVPIINPFKDNPKDHLCIKTYRYYEKTIMGRRTIDLLELNDGIHFVKPRFEIGNEIIDRLNGIKSDLEESTTDKQYKYIRRLKNLMETGNRKKEYSALVSTVILSEPSYIEIEKKIKVLDLWDGEFDALKAELEFCALL